MKEGVPWERVMQTLSFAIKLSHWACRIFYKRTQCSKPINFIWACTSIRKSRVIIRHLILLRIPWRLKRHTFTAFYFEFIALFIVWISIRHFWFRLENCLSSAISSQVEFRVSPIASSTFSANFFQFIDRVYLNAPDSMLTRRIEQSSHTKRARASLLRAIRLHLRMIYETLIMPPRETRKK